MKYRKVVIFRVIASKCLSTFNASTPRVLAHGNCAMGYGRHSPTIRQMAAEPRLRWRWLLKNSKSELTVCLRLLA